MQLNSTEYPGYSNNFQQFVSTNKGKSIMFKHTDEKNVSNDVIIYVVDVCADYFTFKYTECYEVARAGDLEVLKTLLENDNFDKCKALEAAASNGHLHILKLRLYI